MSIPIFPDTLSIGPTFPVMKSPEWSTIESSSDAFVTVRQPQTKNPIWHWTLTYEGLSDLEQSQIDGYQTLQGFYLLRRARFADFLYFDHSDNTAGPRTWDYPTFFKAGETIIDPAGHLQTAITGGSTGSAFPTWNDSGGITTDGQVSWQDGGVFNGANAQPLSIVTDGLGKYYSPLQRLFGGSFYEDVTDLRSSVIPLRVWNNGTLKVLGTDYFISGPSLGGPQLVLPDGTAYEGLYIIWGAAAVGGWVPGAAYALNYTLVDPAGHIQKVTTAGNASTTAVGLTIPQPAWNDSGGTTSDGSVVWTDQGVATSPGGPITASFQFYFRVTFEEDQQDFEQFINSMWTIGGDSGVNGKGMLKFHTSKLLTPAISAPLNIPAAVSNPPVGTKILVLYPYEPTPPILIYLNGSLSVGGGDCLLTGSSFSSGPGQAPGTISLEKLICRSADPAPTGTIKQFKLPLWLDIARVTAAFAVVGGAKFDTANTAPATPTIQSGLAAGQLGCPHLGYTWCSCGGSFVVFGGGHCLIQFHMEDGVTSEFFGGSFANTTDSYGDIPFPDNTRQISPNTPLKIPTVPLSTMHYASPSIIPFANIKLTASLANVSGARLDSIWGGSLALVLWYT